MHEGKELQENDTSKTVMLVQLVHQNKALVLCHCPAGFKNVAY